MSHPTHIFRSLDQLLNHMLGDEKTGVQGHRREQSKRHWTGKWNKFTARHGKTPYLVRCSVCFGKDQRFFIKNGTLKDPRKEIEPQISDWL